MKTLPGILSVTFCLLAFIVCNSQAPAPWNVTVSIEIAQPRTGDITLVKLDPHGRQPSNAAVEVFNVNGKVGTKQVALNQPTLYNVNVYNERQIQVVLFKNNIKVIIDENGGARIEGSDEITQFQKISQLYNSHEKDPEFLKLSERYEKAQASTDTIEMQDIAFDAEAIINNYREKVAAHIASTPLSYGSIIGAYGTFDTFEQYPALIALAARVRREWPAHFELGQLFLKTVEDLKPVGSIAPDFNLQGIKLSDYRGKYLLLRFTAGQSLHQMEPDPSGDSQFASLYHAYGSENIAALVIGITEKDEGKVSYWNREAGGILYNITRVRDFQEGIYDLPETMRAFNCSTLPCEYLIGPDGKVLQKNPKLEQLHIKLESLFRKTSSHKPTTFSSKSKYINGLAAAKKDGSTGAVNRYNEVVVPFIYKSIIASSPEIILVKDNNGMGAVNWSGQEVIPGVYKLLELPSDGLIQAKANNDKYGFFDLNGKVQIQMEYTRASNFHKGVALVEKDGKIGGINKQNQVVIPFEYTNQYPADDFKNGYAVLGKGGKYGMIDPTGKVIIPFTYDDLGDFNYQGLATAKLQGSVGLINKNNEQVVPVKYQDVRVPVNGFAVVKDGSNNFGMYSIQAKKEILPPTYDMVWQFYGKFATFMHKDEKGKSVYGYFNKEGKIIGSSDYTTRRSFSEGLCSVQNKDGKFGYINESGEVVIPFNYEAATSFRDGKAEVRRKGEVTIINKEGKKIQ